MHCSVMLTIHKIFAFKANGVVWMDVEKKQESPIGRILWKFCSGTHIHNFRNHRRFMKAA